MKKKAGKNGKIGGIVLAMLGVMFLAVMVDFFGKGSVGEGVISLVLAVACGFGAYKLLIKKPKQQPTRTTQTPPVSAQAAQPRMTFQTVSSYTPDIPQQPKGFPAKRGYFIKYHYDDVEVATRDRYADHALQPGDALTFRPEPENRYDPGAVEIYHGAEKVGYMYRGRLQDMCRDFIERGDKVAGVVVSDDFGKTVYKIAFYARKTVETVIDEGQL
ncbi:MAG: hypothetical protein IJ662_04370 [Clostridia bacterium]|nr:hypothetical protein [Clostridia bacterium]